MKKLIVVLLSLLLALSAQAVDAVRAVNPTSWNANEANGTGVVGGIPSRSVSVTVNGAAQGDDTAAINAAIAAATANTRVRLPAATYTVGGVINMRNDVSLGGDGTGQTILLGSGSYDHMFFMGIDGDWPWSPSGTFFSSNASQGASTITLSSASSFSVGQMVALSQDNWFSVTDTSWVEYKFSSGGTTNLQRQLVTITGKSGNTLTVSPALYTNYTTARNAVAHIVFGDYQHGVGIEDLTIDGNGTVHNGINSWQAFGCWVKNVEIKRVISYGIFFIENVHSEIRHCTLDLNNGGSNGAAILLERSSANLIEDNYIPRAFPGIEVNYGSTGNAICYNFFQDSSVGGTVGASIDSNHGPHNAWNLYEGNVAPNIQCDGFFGSTSDDVVFRNWLTSVSPNAASPRSPVLLNRGTRKYALVKNIFGTNGQNVGTYWLGFPNMGNGSSTGTAQWTVNDNWISYPTVTDPSSDPTGFAASYQELDLDVQATLILRGNYNTQDDAIPAGEAMGSFTVLDSYVHATKPPFMGNKNWPIIDPANGMTMPSDASFLPAGHRALLGNENYLSGGDTTAPTPDPATINGTPSHTATTITVIANTGTDAGSPPVSYQFSSDNGSSWTVAQSSATYTFTSLTPSTTYQMKVRSLDTALNTTAASTASAVTTDAAPASSSRARLRRGASGF